MPAFSISECFGKLADDFGAGEPVSNFFCRGFGSVRAMNRVFADGQGKFLADGAFSSIGWVGCAHNFTVLGDCVFAFEYLNNGWAGRHEFYQFADERTLFMYCVKSFSFTTAHPDAL